MNNFKNFKNFFKATGVCLAFAGAICGACILLWEIRYNQSADEKAFALSMFALLVLPFICNSWVEEFWRRERRSRYLPWVRRIASIGALIAVIVAVILNYRATQLDYISSTHQGMQFVANVAIRFVVLGLCVVILTHTPPKILTPEEKREAELRSLIERKQNIIRRAEELILDNQQTIMQAEEDLPQLQQELLDLLERKSERLES